MLKYVRMAVLAAAIGTTMTGAGAQATDKCVDMGSSHLVVGGPAPIYRPEYIDTDPNACRYAADGYVESVRAVIPGGGR